MTTNETERLIRMETKLDLALSAQADHERRIRFLERVIWFAAGAGGLVGAGAMRLMG